MLLLISIPAICQDNPPVFDETVSFFVLQNDANASADINATDGDGGAPDTGITYSLSGTDANDFVIDNATGVITFVTTTVFNNPTEPKIFANFINSVNGPSPWNNIGVLNTIDLLDEQGDATAIDLSFQSGAWSSFNSGAVTGDDSGIFPDNVMRDYYYFGWSPTPATTVDLLVSDLDPSRQYNFEFFSSSVWTGGNPDNGNTVFTINGQSVSLNVQGNTTNTVRIDQVSPDVAGEVIITMSEGVNATAGFLNALILETVPLDNTYDVVVTADDGVNTTDQAITITVLENCPVPANLVVTNIQETSVTLSWDDFGSTQQYQYWTTETGLVSTQENSVTITNLDPGTTYDWSVRTQCIDNVYTPYSQSTFTTAGTGCVTPVTLNVTGISDTEATISWDPVNSISSYQYWVEGSTVVSTTNSSVMLTGLDPGRQYDWSVRARCSDNSTTAYANSTFTTTGQGCSAPIGTNATLITDNSATISWDPVNSSSSYQVYFPLTGLSTVTETSIDLTGLDAARNYQWSVKAQCTDGSFTSYTSDNFSTTGTTACTAPVNLNSGFTDPTTTFSWDGLPTSQTVYQIWIEGIGVIPGFQTSPEYITTAIPQGTNAQWAVRGFCFNFGASTAWSASTFNNARTSNDIFDLIPVEDMIAADQYVDRLSNGDKEALFDRFILYPNPAQDVINIGFTQAKEEVRSFKVTSLSGRDVSGQVRILEENKLDISQLKKGIYFIEMYSNKGIYKEKLVK